MKYASSPSLPELVVYLLVDVRGGEEDGWLHVGQRLEERGGVSHQVGLGGKNQNNRHFPKSELILV